MGTMSVRSTYALDTETAQLIRQLAAIWGVSQAEVIRRSVRIAVAAKEPAAPTPAEVVEHYRTHAIPRDREETERLIAELRAQRQEDDLLRTCRHG
ncbi:hypothetical protein [uncultured Thiodictyon sp.]|uniref:hypothetical protein n=1 Tax=uncultured Thiodictyon sp. TaxID=1846217 RepID=UPI0025F2F6ED|nr:hypothetical protein [uncultured Thiodictyon sp.]